MTAVSLARGWLGLDGRRIARDPPDPPVDVMRLAFLGLAAAGALGALAWSNGAALRNDPLAKPAFWAALAVLYVPFAFHLLRPVVAESERLWALLVLGLALVAVKVMASPLRLDHSDEFQHWATAQSLFETGRLFMPNPLLGISPFYPGLEIVDVLVGRLTGLGPLAAGILVVGASRIALLGGLFALFRAVGLGGRGAGLATLFYLDSDLTSFAGQFSYETLALGLAATGLGLAAVARSPGAPAGGRAAVAAIVCLAALAVTHHATSYLTATFLVAAAICASVDPAARGRRIAGWVVAASAVGSVVAWDVVMRHPALPYLLPSIEANAAELHRLFEGQSAPRHLFTGESGEAGDGFRRIVGICGVLVELAAIATGIFRVPSRSADRSPRDRAARWPLAAAAVAYPAALLLRFTHSGWEISNRSSAFLIVGVGFVGALGIAELWAGRTRNVLRLGAVAALLTVAFLGGLTSACCTLQAGVSGVAIDENTADRARIDAASWTLQKLGPGHAVASDRVNRLLLGTYGRQAVVTMSGTEADLAPLFLFDAAGPEEQDAFRRSGAEYLVVDLSLAGGLPGYGNYFEENEDDRVERTPPSIGALEKFDAMGGADRIYDGGKMVIYDARGLR